MKSAITQGKRESVFPVDPRPNRFGCLSITQILRKLHHAHQGKLPRSNRRLADFRIDTGKEGIIVNTSQLITYLHVDVSVWKCCLRYQDGFCRDWGNSASLETH